MKEFKGTKGKWSVGVAPEYKEHSRKYKQQLKNKPVKVWYGK